VAELADAQDLKSCGAKAPCGSDPRPRHFVSNEFGGIDEQRGGTKDDNGLACG
jgi:hypothetical protein